MAGPNVESPLESSAFLDQNALFLLIGAPTRGSDPYPDPPLVPHGRQIRRQHLHHGHVALGERVLLNGHHRKGLDVDVGAQRAESAQQPIVDGQTGDGSVVAHADDEMPRLPVVGKVVGEGADGLAELVRVRRRDRELDAVGLPSRHERAQLVRRQHNPRPGYRVHQGVGRR